MEPRRVPADEPAARWPSLPRTLRGQLILTNVALVIAVVALLGGYLVVAGRERDVDRVAAQLAAHARLVGAAVAPALLAGGGSAEVDPLVKRLAGGIEPRITVIASDGAVLGDSATDPARLPNQANRPEVRAARAAATGDPNQTFSSRDNGLLTVAVPIGSVPGAVARVALPLDAVYVSWREIGRDVAIAVLVGASLAALVAAIVGARIAGPVENLRRQARAVAAGRLDAEVQPARTRELGDLARAFNAMTARLRSSLDERERTRLRLEATLASLGDGVVITDGEGTVVRLNAAAARMLGTAADEAVGNAFVRVSRDHELGALLRDALATHVPQAATIEYGLNRRVLDAAAQPVSGGGEELGLVVLRDVTELRRLERMRREFVANVSHELRTPLSSIRLLVETLEAGALDEPELAQGFLRRIVGEVERLARLVDELLDLARLESGRVSLSRERLAPGDLLATGVERLRPQIERAGLELRLEVPAGLPAVSVDRARIEQVLLNLVHNAIKFTPPGGIISVGARADDGRLTVVVRDSGTGVDPDELPRLFERFYKADKARRSEGTGLGLAIAKHIVLAHGGAIWAESEPGEGATFCFTLPLARDARPLETLAPRVAKSVPATDGAGTTTTSVDEMNPRASATRAS